MKGNKTATITPEQWQDYIDEITEASPIIANIFLKFLLALAPIAPTIKENTPKNKYTKFNSEAKGINTIVFNFINAANKANTGTKLKYAATGNIDGETISAKQKCKGATPNKNNIKNNIAPTINIAILIFSLPKNSAVAL